MICAPFVTAKSNTGVGPGGEKKGPCPVSIAIKGNKVRYLQDNTSLQTSLLHELITVSAESMILIVMVMIILWSYWGGWQSILIIVNKQCTAEPILLLYHPVHQRSASVTPPVYPFILLWKCLKWLKPRYRRPPSFKYKSTEFHNFNHFYPAQGGSHFFLCEHFKAIRNAAIGHRSAGGG